MPEGRLLTAHLRLEGRVHASSVQLSPPMQVRLLPPRYPAAPCNKLLGILSISSMPRHARVERAFTIHPAVPHGLKSGRQTHCPIQRLSSLRLCRGRMPQSIRSIIEPPYPPLMRATYRS